AVDADYYAGGPLADAPVAWQVTTAAATYSPPGWDTFTFGKWTPWWYRDAARSGPSGLAVDGPCCGRPIDDRTKSETFSGTTDAGGSTFLKVNVGTLDPSLDDLPVTVAAQATVTDVNRQAWSSNTTVLVHPAALYVGLRSAQTFVSKGQPMKVDAI